MRHVNIPIFIPHLGCPNQCVFCNQRTISGVTDFDPISVVDIIENALVTIPSDAEVEIAFFGGSFTGIDRGLMLSLLEIADSYVKKGTVHSIRCSTRPDYIDDEIISILQKYGVNTVELGLQSISDKVLEVTKRGHYFEAEKKACELLVKSGIKLVGQMMIGLPSSDLDDELATASFIINAGAREARIYPTVVFRDTELCQMSLDGIYKALTLDDAIKRSAAVLELFVEAKVNVIRIGLQSSNNLFDENSYFAGPNDAALGELVIGELYYNRISRALQVLNPDPTDEITILVSRGSLSKAIGQRRKNKNRLANKYKHIRFAESDGLSEFEISVHINNGENKCI